MAGSGRTYPRGLVQLRQLDPVAQDSTRLISRVRSRYRWFSPTIAFPALLEFGDIWMMRKMLLNIRERAETVPV
ncbi:hypothetical protein QFZ35_002585 [Arthrobacter ulcerisalmonis]|nr:hypothetical protein [Arthrobacter ulcerisalmonis]